MMMMMVMMMNCFCGMVDQQRHLVLFPAGDPHHLESPTCLEQDLNLRRTFRVQALLNEVVH